MAEHGATAQLKRANAGGQVRNSPAACPICRKPFLDDKEVGPIPACECGTRSTPDSEPVQELAVGPEDDFRFPEHVTRICIELNRDGDDDEDN